MSVYVCLCVCVCVSTIIIYTDVALCGLCYSCPDGAEEEDAKQTIADSVFCLMQFTINRVSLEVQSRGRLYISSCACVWGD